MCAGQGLQVRVSPTEWLSGRCPCLWACPWGGLHSFIHVHLRKSDYSCNVTVAGSHDSHVAARNLLEHPYLTISTSVTRWPASLR